MAQEPSDRRRYRRTALSCSVTVFNRGGQAIANGDSLNLSDGGMLVSIPVKDLPAVRTGVNLTFSVPRSTPNTYMPEEFASPATVLRHEALVDETHAGMAMCFDRPLELALKV